MGRLDIVDALLVVVVKCNGHRAGDKGERDKVQDKVQGLGDAVAQLAAGEAVVHHDSWHHVTTCAM